MRQQNDVVQGEEGFGDVGLVREDIEARAGEPAFLERYRRRSAELQDAGVRVASPQATLDSAQVLLPGVFLVRAGDYVEANSLFERIYVDPISKVSIFELTRHDGFPYRLSRVHVGMCIVYQAGRSYA